MVVPNKNNADFFSAFSGLLRMHGGTRYGICVVINLILFINTAHSIAVGFLRIFELSVRARHHGGARQGTMVVQEVLDWERTEVRFFEKNCLLSVLAINNADRHPLMTHSCEVGWYQESPRN